MKVLSLLLLGLVSWQGMAAVPSQLALDNQFKTARANLMLDGQRPDAQLVTEPQAVRHLSWPVLQVMCQLQTDCTLQVLANVTTSGDAGVIISPPIRLNTATGFVNPSLFYQMVNGRFYIGRFALSSGTLTLTLRSQLPHEVHL